MVFPFLFCSLSFSLHLVSLSFCLMCLYGVPIFSCETTHITLCREHSQYSFRSNFGQKMAADPPTAFKVSLRSFVSFACSSNRGSKREIYIRGAKVRGSRHVTSEGFSGKMAQVRFFFLSNFRFSTSHPSPISSSNFDKSRLSTLIH